jgi:pimeloyl-ACP methyl ester carboxylesterase
VSQPRTSTALVTEWHDLLAAAGVPGPYLLVGHSIGVLFPLLYARMYPDQIAGMVLVDPTPPPLLSMLAPESQALFRASLRAPSQITGYVSEQYDLDEILRTLDTAPALRPVPTTLLFAGKEQQVSDARAQALLKDVSRVQDQARTQFAASIPGATTVTVPEATHYIHVERPDAVVDAVKAVAAKT